MTMEQDPQVPDDDGPPFPWDDLRIFLAVFREGSLTAAAKVLGANQSTVSRRLTALEAALGKALFDRLPEGTKATALAEALLPAAERAEEATIELSRVVAGHELEAKGEVRLASVPDLLRTMLAPRLPSLYAAHPKVLLTLLGSSALVDLNRREADLAIRFVKPTHGDLVMRPLMSLPFQVMASPAYLAKRGPVARWSDLDWIGWDDSLAHLPEMSWMRENTAGQPRLRSNDFGTQRSAAEAGVGAFLSAGPPSANLVVVVAAERGTPLPLVRSWLVGHRALRDVPRVKAVWEWLIAMAADVTAETGG